jgi:hypothetical protein
VVLTTDFVKWVSVKCKFNAAFIPLHPRTLQWIDEEDTQVTPSQGTPQFYAIFNNEMRTFPAANGSYTVIGNYLNRSATLTATASSNGWTTRGEKLIRARAVADIRANVLHQQAALMEMGVLVQTGETKYLSAREKQAHDSVLRESREIRVRHNATGLHLMTVIRFGEWLPDQPSFDARDGVDLAPYCLIAKNAVPHILDYSEFPQQAAFSSALTARCQGAAGFVAADGTPHLVAGDATKLYRFADTTATDASKAGGYTIEADQMWRRGQPGLRVQHLRRSASREPQFKPVVLRPVHQHLEAKGQIRCDHQEPLGLGEC